MKSPIIALGELSYHTDHPYSSTTSSSWEVVCKVALLKAACMMIRLSHTSEASASHPLDLSLPHRMLPLPLIPPGNGPTKWALSPCPTQPAPGPSLRSKRKCKHNYHIAFAFCWFLWVQIYDFWHLNPTTQSGEKLPCWKLLQCLHQERSCRWDCFWHFYAPLT